MKDLSARLHYGVKCKPNDPQDDDINTISDMEVDYNDEHLIRGYSYDGCIMTISVYSLSEIKPYLFPLSTLTSKQRTEIGKILTDTQKEYSPYGVVNTEGCDNLFICSVKQSNALINYCLSQHLDINGLIEKGLALDATNLNIY